MLNKYYGRKIQCECFDEVAVCECEICGRDFGEECMNVARVEEGGGIMAQGSTTHICPECSELVYPNVQALMERFNILKNLRAGLGSEGELLDPVRLKEFQFIEKKVNMIKGVLTHGTEKVEEKIRKEIKEKDGQDKKDSQPITEGLAR